MLAINPPQPLVVGDIQGAYIGALDQRALLLLGDTMNGLATTYHQMTCLTHIKKVILIIDTSRQGVDTNFPKRVGGGHSLLF